MCYRYSLFFSIWFGKQSFTQFRSLSLSSLCFIWICFQLIYWNWAAFSLCIRLINRFIRIYIHIHVCVMLYYKHIQTRCAPTFVFVVCGTRIWVCAIACVMVSVSMWWDRRQSECCGTCMWVGCEAFLCVCVCLPLCIEVFIYFVEHGDMFFLLLFLLFIWCIHLNIYFICATKAILPFFRSSLDGRKEKSSQTFKLFWWNFFCGKVCRFPQFRFVAKLKTWKRERKYTDTESDTERERESDQLKTTNKEIR